MVTSPYQWGGGNFKNIIDIFLPVGIIICMSSITDPNNIYPDTIWERIEGRMLIGQSTEGEFNKLGKTGGELNHTLTTAEMPNHMHQQYVTANGGNGGPGIRRDYDEDGVGYIKYDQGITTGDAGGGQPHNNMPPYLVVGMWQRIA